MSTTSTRSPISSRLATQRSPWMSAPAARGLTGTIRLPRPWRSAAIRWLSRYGLGEQPTTAHVSEVVSRSRIVSSSAVAAMPGG
jgi:hypothetical protein